MCGECWWGGKAEKKRKAESYEREKKRTGESGVKPRKEDGLGRMEKSSGCECALSPRRTDSKSLVSQAESLRFHCCRTGSPLISRCLPMTFYCLLGRGMANLRPLLDGIIAVRFSLQSEGIEKVRNFSYF